MARYGENFFYSLPDVLKNVIHTHSDKKWKEDFILHFKCFCDQGSDEEINAYTIKPSIIITFYQKHITRSQEPLISKGDKVEAPDSEGEYHEAIITEVNNDGTYNIRFDFTHRRFIRFDFTRRRNNVRLEEIHLLQSRVEREKTPEGISIWEPSKQEQHFINWVRIGPSRDKSFGKFFYACTGGSNGRRGPTFFERTFTGHHFKINGRVLRYIIVRNRYSFYNVVQRNLMTPHSVLWEPVFHLSSGAWKTIYPIVDYHSRGRFRFLNVLVKGFLNTNSTDKQIKEKQTEWLKKYKLEPHNNNATPSSEVSGQNEVYDQTVNVIRAFMDIPNRNWFITTFPRRSNFLGWSFHYYYKKKSLYYLIPRQGERARGVYLVPYEKLDYLKQYYKDANIPIDTDQGHNIHKIEITPFTPFNIPYNDVGDVWFEPRMSHAVYPIEDIFNNFIDRIEGTGLHDRIHERVRPKYKWRMKDERGDWNNDNFNGQLRRAFVQQNHFKKKWNFGKMPTWNKIQRQFEANVDGRRECRAFFEIHLRCTTKEEETKWPLWTGAFSEPSTYLPEKNKINLKF